MIYIPTIPLWTRSTSDWLYHFENLSTSCARMLNISTSVSIRTSRKTTRYRVATWNCICNRHRRLYDRGRRPTSYMINMYFFKEGLTPAQGVLDSPGGGLEPCSRRAGGAWPAWRRAWALLEEGLGGWWDRVSLDAGLCVFFIFLKLCPRGEPVSAGEGLDRRGSSRVAPSDANIINDDLGRVLRDDCPCNEFSLVVQVETGRRDDRS